MKTKNTHITPEHAAWLDKVESNERRCRALALADLFARAAAEPTHVADIETSNRVNEGLTYIADDHIEDLAALLKLTDSNGEKGGE